MLRNARALILGFTFGVLVAAILIQQLITCELSVPIIENAQNPPTSPPHRLLRDMASSLRNPLQIARRALHHGYKGAHSARTPLPQTARSSLLRPTSTFVSPVNIYSASTPRMASSKSFIEAAKERRSIYELNKNSPIPDSKIAEIIETAADVVPSAFNSQSTRLVVLLNKEHEVFWDQVVDVLKPVVPEEKWAGSQARLDGFKAGYGTVRIRRICVSSTRFSYFITMPWSKEAIHRCILDNPDHA